MTAAMSRHENCKTKSKDLLCIVKSAIPSTTGDSCLQDSAQSLEKQQQQQQQQQQQHHHHRSYSRDMSHSPDHSSTSNSMLQDRVVEWLHSIPTPVFDNHCWESDSEGRANFIPDATSHYNHVSLDKTTAKTTALTERQSAVTEQTSLTKTWTEFDSLITKGKDRGNHAAHYPNMTGGSDMSVNKNAEDSKSKTRRQGSRSAEYDLQNVGSWC